MLILMMITYEFAHDTLRVTGKAPTGMHPIKNLTVISLLRLPHVLIVLIHDRSKIVYIIILLMLQIRLFHSLYRLLPLKICFRLSRLALSVHQFNLLSLTWNEPCHFHRVLARAGFQPSRRYFLMHQLKLLLLSYILPLVFAIFVHL